MSDLHELILEEALPLVAESLEPTSYRLDSRDEPGLVLAYRGIAFLFSTLPVLAPLDFVCWRLPDAPSGTGWPDITGPF